MAVRLTYLAVVFFGLTLCAGCGRKAPSEPDPTKKINLSLAGKRFEFEVALTDEQHRIGLMGRKSLGENKGMLFVFLEDGPRQFWMKNCLIPLDIIYLDRSGRIVGIRTLPPPDPDQPEAIPTYPFPEPIVRYVIELNGGTANRLGLKVGTEIKLPHALLQKKAARAVGTSGDD